MYHIELIFLTVFVIFGLIGVVRGYGRELGVTMVLFLVLFVFGLIDSLFRTKFIGLLTELRVFPDPEAARALIYCIIIIVMTFISYEGETLSFPGRRGQIFFDLGSGLLNGYLFAGSLWYYLKEANWPILRPEDPLSELAKTLAHFLPPAIFKWQYLIGLVLIMLIARIWK